MNEAEVQLTKKFCKEFLDLDIDDLLENLNPVDERSDDSRKYEFSIKDTCMNKLPAAIIYDALIKQNITRSEFSIEKNGGKINFYYNVSILKIVEKAMRKSDKIFCVIDSIVKELKNKTDIYTENRIRKRIKKAINKRNQLFGAADKFIKDDLRKTRNDPPSVMLVGGYHLLYITTRKNMIVAFTGHFLKIPDYSPFTLSHCGSHLLSHDSKTKQFKNAEILRFYSSDE